MALEAGTKLGRYTLLEPMGEGGMATVFRARDDVDGSQHAIKVLHARGAAIQARLLREAATQSRLRHPNILAATGVIDAFGAPAIVMELVDGPTLQALVQAGPLAPDRADALARGILAGMAAAHAAGVVHRDLKPSNILVAVSEGVETPKIADFGLVKGDDDGMTRTGTILGTPGYMAPEQLRDAKRADARADVFSLGAVLYVMTTGELPFRERSLGPLLSAIEAQAYVPLARRAPALGPERVAAVARALCADPADRFADAGAFLEAWSAGAPLGSEPSLAPMPAPHPKVGWGAETIVSLVDATEAWEEDRVAVCALGADEALRRWCGLHRGVELAGRRGFVALLRRGDAVSWPVGARCGVDAGPVRLQQSGSLEADGAVIDRAEALADLAPPGRTLATRAAAEALGRAGTSRGWWSIDAADPIELVELSEDPPARAIPDAERARRVARVGASWRAVAEIPHELPPVGEALVGRTAELAAALQALRDHRTVAIVGPPGVGKSRLAREVAEHARGDFPGGVWWLASPRAARPAGEGARLLILDGASQAEGERGPRDRLLLTSDRASPPCVRLSGLGVEDGIALFEARAQRRQPTFALTDANRADVEAVVRALGGLPLAIVLAADRVAVLPPAKLRARLGDRFRLLTGGDRSLGSAIRARWEELPDPLRAALRAWAAAGAAPDDAARDALRDEGVLVEGAGGWEIEANVRAWVHANAGDG